MNTTLALADAATGSLAADAVPVRLPLAHRPGDARRRAAEMNHDAPDGAASSGAVTADAVSDEELAARMLGGEDEAARALLQRYRLPLFGMLLRQTRNRADAEELFQETFVRALRAADQYDRNRRFKPWLFTIAANLARDRAKRLGHPASPLLTHDGELPEHAGANGEAAEEVHIRRHDLERALDGLSDNHREVVMLRYFEGLDEREIAAVAGIPRGTVKSRLHHALRKMRGLLRGNRDDS